MRRSGVGVGVGVDEVVEEDEVEEEDEEEVDALVKPVVLVCLGGCHFTSLEVVVVVRGRLKRLNGLALLLLKALLFLKAFEALVKPDVLPLLLLLLLLNASDALIKPVVC